MNLHIILGRVGHDPELKYLPSGTAVCNVSIATDEPYKKDGEFQKRTTWHRVTFFGAQAESVAEHVTKGRAIAVTGSVRRKIVKDDDGQREYVDSIARTWQFAGSGNEGTGEEAARSNNGNGRRGTRQQARGGGSSQGQGQRQSSRSGRGGAPAHDDPFGDDVPF